MKSYRYLHYDVFTDHLFGGNQLAVVLDSRDLSTETMQAITMEMNFSETTFMLPPETPGTDVRIHIFTLGEELPMADHPTIGTTFALTRTGIIDSSRSNIIFGCSIEPMPVAMTQKEDDLAFAWMSQPLPTFGLPIPDPTRTTTMLSLPQTTVAKTNHPMQIVSCDVPFLFVPLTTHSAVDNVVVDPQALDELFSTANISAHSIFVFTTDQGDAHTTVYSQMFAPGLGISEDPATGGASKPLSCYLVRHNVVGPEQTTSMLSLQNIKIKRPNHIHISINIENGQIVNMHVGNEAVLANEGTLYL